MIAAIFALGLTVVSAISTDAADARIAAGDLASAKTLLEAEYARPQPLAAKAALALRLANVIIESDPPRALALSQEAAAIFEKAGRRFDHGEALATAALATAYTGKFAEGLPGLLDGAARMRAAASSPEQRENAAYMTSMGALIANELGQRDRAVADQGAAMALLPAEGGGTLAAKTLANAADFAARNSDLDAAIAHGKRGVAILERLRGRDHPDLIDPLGVVGDAYLRAGRYAEAEPVLRRAVTIAETRADAPRAATMIALRQLGGFYAQTNRKAAGEAYWKRAIVVGEGDPVAANFLTGTYKDLANHYEDIGRLDEARALNLKAAGIEEKTVGAESPSRGQTLLNIAEIDLKRGDLDGAEAGARKVLAIYEKVLEPANARRGDPLRTLGAIAMKRGDAKEAVALLERALAAMAGRAESSPALLNTRMNAAEALSATEPVNPRGWRLARGAADAMRGRLVREAVLAGASGQAASDQRLFFDRAIDVAWQQQVGVVR